ncbi:hypothetical protein ADICEAN_01428 [Cesiribacter andamanensis AMV16]|uniref:Uncharacterized protein n=2 Tax=Cesiribacter TaxID=1133570 RepID=M7N868_9BACT|nr:hypothetical protein ADICEAN_01428 [Cesiribacter andamanensis AMV16]
MAGGTLVACNTDTSERDGARPGDPDYVSVQGQGVESNQDLETDEYDANTSARLEAERQRVANWTLEDNRFDEVNAQSVEANIGQMEQNFSRIEADIQRASNGAFNQTDANTTDLNTSDAQAMAGELSKDAREKLQEAQEKLDEAREKMQEARQKQQAGDHDDASEKLKDANEKIGEAREKYLEVIEKHTGVDQD